MSADSLAELVCAHLWARDSAAQASGLILSQVASGQAEIRLQVTDGCLNSLGICNSGVIYTLGDTALLYAANSHNRRTVTQSATIAYLAQAKAGDMLAATARQISRSGRSATYCVDIRTSHDVLIAQMLGQTRTVRGEWLQSFAP